MLAPGHLNIRIGRFRPISRAAFTAPAAPAVLQRAPLRTFHVLELALYHSLGKLPEPESTHDFF